MALPAGLLASLMTGAPIALPKLACGVCAAVRAAADPTCLRDPIASATTLYGGTLVCDAHAASEHARAGEVAGNVATLAAGAMVYADATAGDLTSYAAELAKRADERDERARRRRAELAGELAADAGAS